MLGIFSKSHSDVAPWAPTAAPLGGDGGSDHVKQGSMARKIAIYAMLICGLLGGIGLIPRFTSYTFPTWFAVPLLVTAGIGCFLGFIAYLVADATAE